MWLLCAMFCSLNNVLSESVCMHECSYNAYACNGMLGISTQAYFHMHAGHLLDVSSHTLLPLKGHVSKVNKQTNMQQFLSSVIFIIKASCVARCERVMVFLSCGQRKIIMIFVLRTCRP